MDADQEKIQIMNLLVILITRLGGTVEITSQELEAFEKLSVKTIPILEGVRLRVYDPARPEGLFQLPQSNHH